VLARLLSIITGLADHLAQARLLWDRIRENAKVGNRPGDDLGPAGENKPGYEMNDEKVIEQLAKLSERQREVLRLVCEGLDYETIGKRLFIGVSTVKTHMQQVYFRLDVKQFDPRERLRILFEKYCPALKAGLPPPPEEPERLELVPIEVQEMVEEDGRALALRRQALPPAPIVGEIVEGEWEEPKREPRQFQWGSFLAGVLLGGLLTAGIIFGLRGLPGEGEPQTETPLATVAGPVTEVAAVVTGTPDPNLPTITPVMQTVVVTQEVTVFVTATPLPETATPTLTATPSLALPFQDNFDQGLSPQWRVVSGVPVVSNGQLGSAGDSLLLEIGDSSLGNYTVSFDFDFPVFPTIAGKVMFNLASGCACSRLEVFQDNDWVTIAETYQLPADGNLRIVVASGKYSIFIDGGLQLEAIYGSTLFGPFSLRIDKNGTVDNFSMTSP